MSVKLKFIIFQIIIIAPFVTGYFSGKFPGNSLNTAKKLIKLNLVSFEPFVIFWSIWGLTLLFDQIFLPISGVAIVITGFLIGIITIPVLRLTGTSRKTYLISSSLANHGFTMGGFICYLLLGEKGIGLASIFTLYFLPYTFIFIFTYARTDSVKKLLSIRGFINNFINLQNMPLYATFSALILNLAGIKRPEVYMPIDVLLIISVGIYYFTLGLNFNFGNISSTCKEHLILAFTKFLILPAAVYIILNFTDLSHDVKTVILVESLMPAAVYSVITSILFDLDSKLASSLFVVNTILFLLFILPAIFIFKGVAGI
ncbi:MAG: AEC family transporter [Spirochaetes bacterium]|nr:AEC family transporter [Spirochaetota bacterium]